jgi:mRNA interferase MazF
LRIIVPITDWKEKYELAPWMITINPSKTNGLYKISCADCFQIRSVSEERFFRKIGVVSQSVADAIRIGLSKVLSIEQKG